jgi:hypothetical protein
MCSTASGGEPYGGRGVHFMILPTDERNATLTATRHTSFLRERTQVRPCRDFLHASVQHDAALFVAARLWLATLCSRANFFGFTDE